MLSNCHEFTIYCNELTNVQGNQQNYTLPFQVIENRHDAPHFPISETSDVGLYQHNDYSAIPTGSVHLEKKFGPDLPVDDHRNLPKLRAWQSIHAASIPSMSPNSRFLYVSYRGPDAHEAFRNEFLRYSRIKSVKAAQLLGYNSSTLPALVFYDALIPLANVLNCHPRSPLLRLYFSCQWELFDHSVTALYNPQSLVYDTNYSQRVIYQVLSNELTDGSTDFQLLWVQPQTGSLCVGPRGPELECQFMLADLPSPIIDVCNSEDPLPIDAYQDENIVHYFSRAINDQDFIDWFFTRAHFDVLQADLDEEEVRGLSSSNGAIHSDSRGKHIARCEDISKSCSWTTTYIRVSSGKLERSRTQMADGSIRFTFTSPKQFHLCFGHEFGDCHVQEALLRSWLSQAHRVFDHLHMSRNDARQCSMTRKVYTSLEGNAPGSVSQRNPCFLFIRPFPSTPAGQPDFAAWQHGNMIHWSSDASGRTWVLNDAQQTPGFPKITLQIKTLTYKWDDIIYSAARRIQEFKGFDPRTRDFARSLELPAFEVEFEDAKGEDDNMNVDSCETQMDVD